MKNIVFQLLLISVFSQNIYCQYYKIELVKDILPGATGSNPQDLVKASNYLYFAANDGVHGIELWKSDGTEVGTQMVMDINPNGNTSSEPGDLVTAGDNVFFRASDGMYGFELWRSQFNGVGAGTTTMVKDINPFGSSNPVYFTNTNGTLKFVANNGLNGDELWHSDATTMGTNMVEDLLPGPANGYPYVLFPINNRVFFRTIFDGGLYSASSNNINGPIEVITYNDDDVSPLNFGKINNTLFFSGVGKNAFLDIGRELFYKEEGGEPVKLRKDINPGPGSSNPTQLTTVGETLYFVANNGSNIGLWKTTELGEALLVKSFSSATSLSSLVSMGNRLYFFAHNGADTQLWISYGTENSTELVKTLNNNPSFIIPDAINFGGTLIFSILHPTDGKEIWQSDGSNAGTFVIKDINPGSNGSDPDHFTLVDNNLYFTADNGDIGRELYKMANCNSAEINFTIKDGNWTDKTTWACGRVPFNDDQVTIKGHTININGNIGIKNIFFEGGNITIPNGATLTLNNIIP
jgi:trimeric autotransporter adhesin